MNQEQGLEGIKIVDASAYGAGPIATRILADWGASVTKVEHPIRGDITRTAQSSGMRGVAAESPINYVWELYNRNKRSVGIDLAHEDGHQILRRLIDDADVFVSTFRPRELEKFDLEYGSLSKTNPALIHATLTAWGIDGPERDMPGFDVTSFWARTGAMHLHSEQSDVPERLRPAFGDNLSGLSLALGITTALLVRERTGLGQAVDTSLLQTGAYAMSYDISGALATGSDLGPVPRDKRLNALDIQYQTSDGRWIMLCMFNPDPYWPILCAALGREDLISDGRFGTTDERARNHTALRTILEGEFAKYDYATLAQMLTSGRVPWGGMQTVKEFTTDPQATANDLFLEFDHPRYGRIKEMTGPVRLSATEIRLERAAPKLGEHTREVLTEAGYLPEEIDAFATAGVAK